MRTLQHPPYSPDMAAADFYLFPQLKSALMRQLKTSKVCSTNSSSHHLHWLKFFMGILRLYGKIINAIYWIPQPLLPYLLICSSLFSLTFPCLNSWVVSLNDLPYNLESNPHPFYSFRGLKNQTRIRIACGLDSRSRAGFWKNDRAAVRAVRTIQ